jgi:hypothetical protein
MSEWKSKNRMNLDESLKYFIDLIGETRKKILKFYQFIVKLVIY